MSNTYNISVTYEVVTDESAEQGDVAERGYEREREDFDENEVQRLVREYGFSEPSSTRLDSASALGQWRTADPGRLCRHCQDGTHQDARAEHGGHSNSAGG